MLYEAARKAIAELKKQNCGVIIVLAHMEENEQKKLALVIPDIHFIVSGYVRKLKREPLVVNNVEILMAGARGEYLGRMDFSFKKSKEEGERGLSSQYQIVALWERYKDHFQTAELIEQYKMQLENLSQTRSKMVIQESGPVNQQ